MQANEVVARIFEAENVDTVFTYMAEDNLSLVGRLAEDDTNEINVVDTRHEQNAIAMANGYHLATNNVGVATVGRGPGIAQTGTALVTAQKKNLDVLVLVPEFPVHSRYDTKYFDQSAFLKSTIGNLISVRSHETLVEGVREGFRKVRTESGPVAVQISWDLLNADMEEPDDLKPGKAYHPEASSPTLEPDQRQIDQTIELFLESDATELPVIIAGRGAYLSESKPQLEKLAKYTSGLLATTLEAKGYFSDHPYSIGFVGDAGSNLANNYLSESDFIIGVGCSLNPHTTDEGHLIRDEAKVVQIDSNPASIGRYTPIDVGIQGDASATVERLVEEFEKQGINRKGELWSDNIKREIHETPDLDQGQFPEREGRIDPRDVVRGLDEMLPDDRKITIDAGHFLYWTLDKMSTNHPSDFIWTADFASVGQGFSTGVGATIGTEDRPCVTICGDGGFMMSSQELDTLVRHDVPMITIIMNDGALGSEYVLLNKWRQDPDVTLLDNPDFASVAETIGIESYTVRSIEDLESLEGVLGQEPEEPILIDCKVNREVLHRTKQ
jgi:thiamine pyrophosphate-dependent acetolactate synthase large subunit-like protein